MSLRIALLGLLTADGPASGYDLTKKFERSINYVWQAGHSQIYPELAKMAADALITVEAEGARGRKIYTVTREGEDELRRWLIERTPAIPARSENALQAFLLPLLDPAEGLAVLDRMVAQTRARLEELESLRASMPPDSCEAMERLGTFALDLGIRNLGGLLGWALDTSAAISTTAGDRPPAAPDA